MLIRCKNCFQEYNEDFGLCPLCGYADGEPPEKPFCLSPGTVIAGRYIIGQELNSGGFGIVYKAWDKKLDTVLAIKEYYPSGLVNRQPGSTDVMLVATKREREFVYGKTRFLEEARNLAKFSDHKNIVNVYDFFESNNTAYIVMEYLDGRNLRQVLEEQNVPLPVDYCITVATQVGAALKAIHKENILHRDISPDNIMICNDGSVKLFDFGAARFSANVENRVTVVVKPGYAPPEQYDKVNRQGPRTDIYALGATLYHAMTGVMPEESTNRKIEDKLLAPAAIDKDIPENISNSIMRAMAIEQQYRFSTVDDFVSALTKGKKVASVQKERAKRRRHRAIGILVSLLIIVGATVAAFYVLNDQKRANTLPDATLDVWYIQTGNAEMDENKAVALENIIENFTSEYNNVKIKLTGVPSESYLSNLMETAGMEQTPSIFESTGFDVSNFAAALPDTSLNSDFIVPTEDQIKFSTGIIAPIIYVNSTMGSLESTDTLEAILQWCNDQNLPVAIDNAAISMYAQIYGSGAKEYVSNTAKEDFMNRSVAVYLGSSSCYTDVQKALPGEYVVMFPDCGMMTYQAGTQWSISDVESDDLKVATAFIDYLSSSLAQDYFHIQNQSGELPIIKDSLSEYIKIYGELSAVQDFLSLPYAPPIEDMAVIQDVPSELRNATYDIQKQDMSVQNDQGETIAELFYDLVVLTSDGRGVDKINQTLDLGYQEYRSSNQTVTAESLSEEAHLPYFNTYAANVTHNEDGVFSIKFDADWYWGGVHNINYYGKTFDLNSGEELIIKDLIEANASTLSVYLKETAKQYIQNENSGDFMNDAEQKIDTYELDGFPFYIEEKQIVLCFETYELASGAAGPTTIPTGLFLGRENTVDMVQLLLGGEDNGTWSWLEKMPDDSTLFGQIRFEQDMTCTMDYGYYQSESFGSLSGNYTLDEDILTIDLTNSETGDTYHHQFHVEPIGDKIAFTQISEKGIFYFHAPDTILLLQSTVVNLRRGSKTAKIQGK